MWTYIKMTTFVTALHLLDGFNVPGKSHDIYFDLFEKLAGTGVSIAIYSSKIFEERMEKLCEKYVNIKLFKVQELSDSWTYKTITKFNPELPANRNPIKDSLEFMIAMNAKIEYVQEVIVKNPFNTKYFAWIDFGIFHVLKNIQLANNIITKIGTGKLVDRLLVFPGCWQKNYQISLLFNNIHWRFCGGFFIGDEDSLIHMWNIYQQYLPQFLSQYKKVVWEVNIWTAMETFACWSPEWYQGNHDDSILSLPDKYFE
jgi:hypothetical protein